MENENKEITSWQPTDMLEVTLNEPDDFLKIRETLTRIGVASRKDQKLYQSCHCLLYTSPSPRDVEESRMPSSA